MFDRFGEFDSAQEINKAAAGLLAEGDIQAVYDLAQENGIDREDAEDFIDGAVPELANPLMAALGKLKAEGADLHVEGIMKDWQEKVMEICMEDEDVCAVVRKKSRSLKYCLAAMVKFAFENKVKVSDKIVDEVRIMHNGKMENMKKPLYLGIPDNAQAKGIIKDYYKL